MIDTLLSFGGFESRWAPTARGPMKTRAIGKPTNANVLFVHGFGRGGAQLLPLACAFRSVRRCLVPDLHDLGGESQSHLGRSTVVDHADALSELLEDTGPADVVGISFGGWVACWLAARRPDLVRSVFLVNPAGFRDGAEELEDLYRSTALGPELYDRVVSGRPFVGVPLVSWAIEKAFTRTLRDPRIGKFLDTVEESHFVEAALDDIACPTYALLSTNDALLKPRSTARELLKRVRNIEGAWIDGASHNVGYEAFELVAEQLALFLGLDRAPYSSVLTAAAHLGMPPSLRPLREVLA